MPASAYKSILRDAGVAFESVESGLGAVARVSAADIRAALGTLAANGFEQLVDILGTDTGEAVEVTYHTRSLSDFESVFIKVNVDYDGEIPSVWEVYPAALFPERETAELLGVSFPGHPNPKRLLTVEGTEPLLRKSVEIRGPEEVRYS